MRATLLVVALSVAVDALTREQAKANKLCRKVKKRKTKYVAAKEKYEEKYEKSCEEEAGVKATCAECAGVVCKWAAFPSTREELDRVLQDMPKEYVGCCVDTSEVTDFSSLDFSYLGSSMNDVLFCWDTAKATTFEKMVSGATEFNGALLGWDTSKVTTMYATFLNAQAFNQKLIWDTSSVTSMWNTFLNAQAFNQQLIWDTSKVTNMWYTFSSQTGGTAFNQPLVWDTSSVTDMQYAFLNADAFNSELDWDTSAVTDMNGMFSARPSSTATSPTGMWPRDRVLLAWCAAPGPTAPPSPCAA